MKHSSLPEITIEHDGALDFEAPLASVAQWDATLSAQASNEPAIDIYEAIGPDALGGGVTAQSVAAQLRQLGNVPVVVNINSPGGHFFEGVAIYNLLRKHSAKVTVHVLGLAASAASLIAMAGDEILMADGAMMMIHNAQGVGAGDKHGMQHLHTLLASLDAQMAQVYASRTGHSHQRIAQMLDATTWLTVAEAIEQGFATGRLQDAPVVRASAEESHLRSVRVVENALRKEGRSRSERRQILSSLFADKPSAVGDTATPSAGDADVAQALQGLLSNLQNFRK